MNMEEVWKMFIVSSTQRVFGESLVMVLEKQIPKAPKHRQKEMRRNLSKLQKNPQSLFSGVNIGVAAEDTPRAPINKDDEGYKIFYEICEDLDKYFNENTEMIKSVMIAAHASNGITLIITDD